MMLTGRIKYYNSDKGYGFIAQDSGEDDVFLHISSIKGGYDEIHVGERVRYEVTVGTRGPVAQNVKILLTPLEQKRLRQGKVVIPRDYALPQQPRASAGERSFLPSQKSAQFTPAASAPQKPKQKTEASSVQAATSEPIESPPDQKPSLQHAPKPQAESKPKSASTPDEQPTFGDLYIQKQIRLHTPMFFGLYSHVLLPATVTGFTKYDFVLQGEEEKRELPKTDVKYCYKAEDATEIQSIMRYNEEVKARAFQPIIQRKKRYNIDTRVIVQARRARYPIEVTMLEGEAFRGWVDWVSRYEIKMLLENDSKIVVFRHAISDFKAFPPDGPDQNHAGNDKQTTEEETAGEGGS